MRSATVALALFLGWNTSLASDGEPWRSFGERSARVEEPGTGPPPPIARIYNGTVTRDYPAVAGLVISSPGSVALCTGTLVSPSVVVTAAHCFDGAPTRVVAGFFPDGVTEQDYEGVASAQSPSYSPGRLAYADIALLFLVNPVQGVTPMPLASTAPRPRRPGIVVGFGQNEAGRIGVKEMGRVRLRRCPRLFLPAGLLRGQLATSLCWRPKPRSQDTCHGDSGGPLILNGAVVGITSGGYPDCPGKLSWDTNVALFRPWMDPLLR